MASYLETNFAQSAWWRTQSQSNRSRKPNSLLTGKITGNFEHSGPVGGDAGNICEANQGLANEFPCSTEQGIFVT
jgi:hypothetical protein